MFEQDYLMRMIMQLINGINRSIELRNKRDPRTAAQGLEDAIGSATDIDGGVLLSLSPESIASILDVSGTDPRVVEYIGRSLHLESSYLDEAGDCDLALLRAQQAEALACAYGFLLDGGDGAQAAMQAFLADEEERMNAAGTVAE